MIDDVSVEKEVIVDKEKKSEGHLIDHKSLMMYFGAMMPNNRHVIRITPQIVYGSVQKAQPDKNKVVWRVKSKITLLLKSLPKLKSTSDQ